MIPTFILYAALAASPSHASASVQNCKATQYGQCSKVRGRYGIYAENDFLWIVGSRHMFVAVDDRLDNMLENAGWEEHFIFGDFVICPTSPYEKGHMQAACIQSYEHLKMTKRD